MESSSQTGWTRGRAAELMALPLPELMFRAISVYRAHFDICLPQTLTLLSVKTGGFGSDARVAIRLARARLSWSSSQRVLLCKQAISVYLPVVRQ
jgi:hypothetical protein